LPEADALRAFAADRLTEEGKTHILATPTTYHRRKDELMLTNDFMQMKTNEMAPPKPKPKPSGPDIDIGGGGWGD